MPGLADRVLYIRRRGDALEGTTMTTSTRTRRRRSGPHPHLPVRDEAGMNTAEYAVGTVGACGFAGLLYQLLTSDFGRQLLQTLFDKVLTLLPF